MKRGIKLGFVVTLAALSGMGNAAAKIQPGANGDQWLIDWGDNYCGATRFVDRGNVAMTFEKPLPGKPGAVSFGNGRWIEDPTDGRDVNLTIVLHPSGEQLSGPVTALPAVKGTLLRVEGLDAAAIDRIGSAQSADLLFGERRLVSVDLADAPAAFVQLQKCQDDLLAKAGGGAKTP
jgi:hypothetical protein